MARNGESRSMGPKLWGTLQSYLDLKNIYVRLPIEDFFRLRLVCKEWNRLASDREFLESTFTTPIAKPYFLVIAASWIEKLHGLLSFDASSRRWNWTRLPSLDYRSGILEVKGLVYSYNYNSEQQVFNAHTRVCHRLPLPAEVSSSNDPFVGLRVDTSVIPYAFQVLYASSDICTQIFDSKTNSWKLKTEKHPEMAPGRATCAECNGFVYIRSELDLMYTYDLEKNVWGFLEPPAGDCDDYLRSIGAWQGRLFDVTVDIEKRSVTAWVLADHSKQEWTAFERMPEEFFAFLTYDDNPDIPVDVADIEIRTNFCDEYVLVYTWLLEEGMAERFIMCNLDTKVWEKVDVPFGACSILKECEL